MRAVQAAGLMLLVLALALSVSLPIQAQTSFGTIVGNVTDESGALIPGVTVTVTNVATSATRSGTTSETGGYTIPSLPPAVYNVEAELTGFQKAIARDVRLEVNQTLRVDLALKVGELTETIEVTASAPQLQTDTSTVATTVDNTKVVELPLNGRSFTQLTILTPGAVANTGANTAFRTSGNSTSVSGLRSEANNYTLDGVNNNESFFKTFGLQPSIDAIQEFRIQTNITSSEFGTAAGANINVVTKSGTNEFHGTVFEFLRNDNFDASQFFANRSGAEKPEFRQNQFGATVGGPIIKNKTFFFFMYEGQRRAQESTILGNVPTTAQFGGDLSGGPQVFNPFSTVELPDGTLVRDPIPNNQIPSSLMNPATVEYARILYSPPNLPGQVLNLLNSKPSRVDNDQWMGKVDHRFGDNNILTGRFNFSDSTNPRPTGMLTVDNLLTNTFTNIMISDTHTLNPTTIMDFKISYHRNNLQIADSAPGGLEGVEQFLAAHPLSGVPVLKSAATPLYPGFFITGFTSPSQTGFPFPDDTYSALASVTKIKGNHSIKVGFEFKHNRNLDDGFFTGNFTFNKNPTVDPQDVENTGQAVAAYLMGLPNVAQRNIGDTTALMRREDYSFYFQDDWKVTPNLTMNLGLRYDYIEWPKHRDDKLASIDIGTGEFLWDGTNPVTGEAPNVRRGVMEPDYNNFAPRLGLAYRVGDRTTVRAGYGIFYMSNYLWEAQGVRGNWPFAISDNLGSLNDRFPTSPVESTFSPELSIQPGSTVTPSAQHIVQRHNRTSYTQQWNLHVQRQLAEDLMVEVGYVGTRGLKLSSFMNVNAAPPGPGEVTPRRPFPQYGPMSQMDFSGMSTYHGLQFKIDKRFNRGLSFRGNYAFGKVLDTMGAGFGASAATQNPFNIRADRALSDLHRAHTFTFDYIWEIPFGKGRTFGADAGGVADAILGGWQLTGIITANSGAPFNVSIPRDIANVGPRSIGQRPNLIGDPFAGVQGAPEQFINRAAFDEPDPFTFGNFGRNVLTGPSLFQFDFGLYKNFRVTERIGIQFRSEFFNFLNNVNFGNPNTNFDADSAVFGSIGGLAAGQYARQVQFGLKVMF